MILYYLSFVIDFKLSLNQKQDFLFFEGVNDSAHLFRQNSTILLNVNNELYKTDIVDRIQFSWKGFKVNGSEMEKIKSTGEGEILTFDAFTFLSPIVKISKEEEEAKEEYFHSFLSQKINYYYIFAIVFLTVLLVDGIEILLSGAAGAMRGFPARLSCAAIRTCCAAVRSDSGSRTTLGLGIRVRDLKKPHFFGLYYPYIPY